jgi:hypothetical protein
MVARVTTTQRDLEIDSTGPNYQTQNAGRPRRHSLYVAAHNPAGKMCLRVLFVNSQDDIILQLLYAVRHLAQCALFIRLQTPVISASSGTTCTSLISHSIVVLVSNCCMFF